MVSQASLGGASRWAPALAAAALVAVVVAAKPLGPISRSIAVACVIAALGAAAFLRRKEIRAHASVVASIAAVTAAGQVDGGALYGICAAGFMLVCVASLRVAQRTAATPVKIGPLAVIFGLTGAVVAVSVLTLPPLAAKVERTITGMFGVDPAQQTAFSSSMTLGATRDMLKSDAIVARIDGGRPEYLRGAVYDRYEHVRWLTTEEGRARTRVPAVAGGSTHLTLDKSAPTGPDLRWFLPPNACQLDREVEVDFFGVARRESGDRTLSYATSGCLPLFVRPATTTDLEVDERLAAILGPIARRWTAGASSPHDKLRRISSELGKFEYSLEVPRADHVDPIVDFLTIHQAGHCEFFASALVLLARTQGIHARVVGGFRVTEVNPITHQAIVRDRNAHAWVEAWYDDGWHAWDPTPVSDGPSIARNFFDHTGDLWALAWERLTSSTIGPLGWALVLLGVIAVLLVIRAIGNYVRRPRRHRRAPSMERPLPCFEVLTDALAAAGFARGDSEPIESFAARIPDPTIASALRAYAAFRYGDIGEERGVIEKVEVAARAAAALGSPQPA